MIHFNLQNFPCEGITVFGNTFHTHLAGENGCVVLCM